MQTVSELSQKVREYQDELKRTKNELQASSIQVAELRKILEELRGDMMSKVGHLRVKALNVVQILSNTLSNFS